LLSVARKLNGLLKVWLCSAAAVWPNAHFCAAQHLSFSPAASGMENLNVNCVAQDRSGYLWVGTENGLYRYDGSQFRKFGPADGLHGRTIQSLFVGLDGTLFVGTTTGLYFERKDGSLAEIYTPAPVDEFSQRIGTVFTAIAQDQVVTLDRSGAFELRRTGAESWAAAPMNLEPGKIWSVLYGPDGALWYGCGSDLCRMAGGKTTHEGAALHLPEDNWLHLQFAAGGHLWIRGLHHLGEVSPAEQTYEEHDLPGESTDVPYDALTVDAQGRIAASQGPAFGLWENGSWRMLTERNGLTRHDISALFTDREGSMWIAVVGHGLMRWVGQDRWEAYTAADGLSDDIVWASLRDTSGRLWIGTESGLDWIPAGDTTARAWQSAGISTVRADSLAEGGDGSIWMGSAAGSLVRIDAKTLAGRQWKVPEVYRVLSDGDHRLWIATGAGLYVVDTASADQSPHLVIDPAHTLPQTRFTDICLDLSGQDSSSPESSGANHLVAKGVRRLWAASDEGLFRMDAKGWTRIDPGLSGVNPSVIAVGRDGILWAAGAVPGILKLHIAGDRVVELQRVTRPHILSEQVVSLTVDHRGWLWAGEDAGLTVFDGHTWRSFTQNDGLIWNDTDGYALSEERDGSMWIGTSGGLAHLMKPETMPVTTPRAPTISEIDFGSRAIATGAQIPWSAEPLTISLAALTFTDADRILFRYRLLGLESEWVETPQETIRYARLEPGSYRFQALTVDANGGAVSTVEEVDFRIAPRWWQNLWLRLIAALLVGLGVVQLWRWRVHRLVGQKQQLEIAVRRRTEDLERDKAELLHAREQMRHYAEHDDLTGLWNHRIIVERLRIEVQRSQREGILLSVILVDLDHFKQINDTFGHPAGDSALKELSAILLHSVRSYDWVGRYGGEEFLLILPGSNFASARIRAEQLRLAVESARIGHGERTIRVTASFGVATGLPSEYEPLIQAADSALYQAKSNGRNCVIATEI
jgi:diguanylate cyclase (GGDEF)-like protein